MAPTVAAMMDPNVLAVDLEAGRGSFQFGRSAGAASPGASTLEATEAAGA